MSSKKIVGCSKASIGKQYGLESLFDYHMRVVKAIQIKWPNSPQRYVYVDTNVGSGRISELDIDGSPSIFLKSAARLGLEYDAYFIDKNDNNAALLMDLVKEGVTVCPGDNRDIVPGICHNVPYGAYGMIYHDPNGYPDFDLMADSFKIGNVQKIDVLVRVSGTSVKRVRTAFPERYPKTLKDHLLSIPKNKWLVRELEPADRFQWTFLFGSNFPSLKDWKKRGFHLIDSHEGKSILDELNFTAKEIGMINQTRIGDIQNAD